MDPDRLVATVCEYLVNTGSVQLHVPSKDAIHETSRHAQLYRQASSVCASDIMAFEFHRTISPVVEAYHALVARPVSAWGDAIGAEQHKDAIAHLCYKFWLIAERHAPGQIAVPVNRPPTTEPDQFGTNNNNHPADTGLNHVHPTT